MIPTTNAILTTNLVIESQPSKTYHLLIDSNRVVGFIDGVEAIKQAVWKILNTERYQYLIYSWNYGVEFMDLYGKETDYVCAELERRITDALLQDDRITSVEDFAFDTSERHSIRCTFTVRTIYGNLDIEKVVEV